MTMETDRLRGWRPLLGGFVAALTWPFLGPVTISLTQSAPPFDPTRSTILFCLAVPFLGALFAGWSAAFKSRREVPVAPDDPPPAFVGRPNLRDRVEAIAGLVCFVSFTAVVIRIGLNDNSGALASAWVGVVAYASLAFYRYTTAAFASRRF